MVTSEIYNPLFLEQQYMLTYPCTAGVTSESWLRVAWSLTCLNSYFLLGVQQKWQPQLLITSLLGTHSAWLTYLSPCLKVIFSFKMVTQTPGSPLICSICYNLHVSYNTLCYSVLTVTRSNNLLVISCLYWISMIICQLSPFTNSFVTPQLLRLL